MDDQEGFSTNKALLFDKTNYAFLEHKDANLFNGSWF
jgi:hypothetical protein